MEAYDQSTGQIYYETSGPVRSMVSTWMSKTRGMPDDPNRYRRRQGPGAAKLYDMAMRSCLWNIGFFSAEVFADVDWHIAQKIYKKLKDTDTLSVKAWSIFRTAYPEEGDRSHRVHIPGTRDKYPHQLPSIASNLSSLPFSFVTILSIHGYALSIDFLLALLDLPNLVVLKIEGDLQYQERRRQFHAGYRPSAEDLDSRSIWAWSRAVQEKKAFQKLKIMMLDYHEFPSVDTLEALAEFPALSLIRLEGAPMSLKSPKGWRHLPDYMPDGITGPKHPDRIWRRIDINPLEKMELLYTSLTASDVCYMSIDYGRPMNHVYSSATWLERVDPHKNDSRNEHTEKRLISAGDSRRDEDTSKRRKVRQAKQQDLGSLLGNFI